MSHIRPLGDRVLVRRFKEEDKSPGGIIIPDVARKKPDEGEVLAVGPGKVHEHTGRRIEPHVKVGDRVLFLKYAGNEALSRDSERGRSPEGETIILREDDILGVVEPS